VSGPHERFAAFLLQTRVSARCDPRRSRRRAESIRWVSAEFASPCPRGALGASPAGRVGRGARRDARRSTPRFRGHAPPALSMASRRTRSLRAIRHHRRGIPTALADIGPRVERFLNLWATSDQRQRPRLAADVRAIAECLRDGKASTACPRAPADLSRSSAVLSEYGRQRPADPAVAPDRSVEPLEVAPVREMHARMSRLDGRDHVAGCLPIRVAYSPDALCLGPPRRCCGLPSRDVRSREACDA